MREGGGQWGEVGAVIDVSLSPYRRSMADGSTTDIAHAALRSCAIVAVSVQDAPWTNFSATSGRDRDAAAACCAATVAMPDACALSRTAESRLKQGVNSAPLKGLATHEQLALAPACSPLRTAQVSSSRVLWVVVVRLYRELTFAHTCNRRLFQQKIERDEKKNRWRTGEWCTVQQR